MPTYEYQCGTCGNRFEKFQSFSDEPIKICPECGNPVKKVFSPAGIIFKGSGWYINDSKKSTSTTAPAPSNSSDKSEKSESAESKPAAETATSGESKSSSDSKSGSDTKPSTSNKSEAAA